MTEPYLNNFMLGNGRCNDIEDVIQSRQAYSLEILAYSE